MGLMVFSGECFAQEWLPQRDFTSIHQYQNKLVYPSYSDDLLLDRNGFESFTPIRKQWYDWWNQPVSGEQFRPTELTRYRMDPYLRGHDNNSGSMRYQRNSPRSYQDNVYSRRNTYIPEYSPTHYDSQYQRYSSYADFKPNRWMEKSAYLSSGNQSYDGVIYTNAYANSDVYYPQEYGYQEESNSGGWEQSQVMDWRDELTPVSQSYRWWDWPVYGE